jgi:3-hydroxybutyryl-CoA dehydrogenase
MTTDLNSPIAVIGAGTLGWQIALTFALKGVEVRLHDAFPDALERGQALLRAEIETLIASGEASAEAMDAPARVIPFTSLAGAVDGVWLVIEAIPERLDLKRAFFTELSALVSPDTVLASNSSSYKSREFAEVTRHPERLLNTHFYGRPWRRPAVELMSCGATDPETIERVRAFFADCGLRPFVCRGESTGFLFNRIWHAVKQESLRVVAEGLAAAAEIDELWRIVMDSEPYGPFERMDRVGLDVVLDIERHYAAESGLARDEPPAMLVEMVERGELGLKTGKGFYTYDESKQR